MNRKKVPGASSDLLRKMKKKNATLTKDPVTLNECKQARNK